MTNNNGLMGMVLVNRLTLWMRGPRVRAESTHLPVMTTSAPRLRASAMGNALREKERDRDRKSEILVTGKL